MGVAAIKPKDLPVAQRAAELQPSTWNPEKRTIDVVFTTGAKGKRWGYSEELEVSDKAVRLGALNAGAAVLDTHGQWSLRDQFGVVVRAWIQDGRGMATLRLSKRADVEEIVQDIADGIIRNISVGYIVHRYQDVSGPDDKSPTYRAVDWEPREISFVPVPFDTGAQVRSADPGKSGGEVPTFPVEIIEAAREAGSTEERAMPPENEKDQKATEAQLDAARKQAAEAERSRIATIHDVAKRLGLKSEFAEEHVTKLTSVEDFRALAIDARAAQDEKTDTRTVNPSVTVVREEADTRAEAISNAILHRANPTLVKLTDAGREWAGMNLREMARDYLERIGVRTRGMTPNTLATEALRVRSFNSTSDFPYILANVAGKALLTAYDQAVRLQTFRPIVRVAYAADFKQVSRVRIGEVPTLEAVPEGAAITYGKMPESREVYNLATYARIFAITRETIVNDDLNAFGTLPARFGAASARLESDIVWAIFTDNADMGDDNPLFDSTNHGNHKSSGGAAPDVTGLSDARVKMRKQKGLSARDFLNIEPKFLCVPTELETAAQQLVNPNMLPSQTSAINPFQSRVQVISEARLSASSTTEWFMTADPAEGWDVIELLYLEGATGPQVETQIGFDVNGVKVKAMHDVAAKALDWRTFYKNKGAA